MGTEQDSAYYDKYYRSRRGHFVAQTSVWYPLWSLAARRLRAARVASVVDVGCGLGAIRELLPDEMRYAGYDFSAVAIERAERRHQRRKLTRWVVRDVHDFDGSEFEDCDGVVACELLEHIEDDLGFLDRIPKSVFTFITVPTFDLSQHVRHFDSRESVFERYSGPLRIAAVRRVGGLHFAAWGRRR